VCGWGTGGDCHYRMEGAVEKVPHTPRSEQDPIAQAEAIRVALRCARPGCPCARPRGPVHCPAHGDEHPSLRVIERGGRVLVWCGAGCPQDRVLGELRRRGLWPEPGLTLEELADAKRLPADFLRSLGVHTVRLRTGRAVAVPYYGPDGEEVATRFRIALHGDRFRWREGARVTAYGLWKLPDFRERRWVLVVEGETDSWTAWYHGLPAIGLPGKSTWRPEWAQHLDGVEVVLWQEPGAEDLVTRVARDLPAARVIVAPPGIKDLSEAHLRGEDVRSLVERLRAAARPAAEIAREVADAELRRLLEQARPVLQHPDPLQLFTESVRRMGYAGDLRPATVTYLAATTRLLQLRSGQMPAHTCLVGPSSAGKSFTWHVVRAHLPDDAVVEIEAGSPRVLIFKDADLRHCVVVFAEVDSLPRGEDNPAASAVRHLLQEHRLRYEVVVRRPDTGDFAVRTVEREGPTLLLTTAVRGPGGQLGTRLWQLPVPDDEARLREVLEAQGLVEEEGAAGPDEALRAYQAVLQKMAPWDVVIPYARALARLLGRSPVGPRVLRDFQRLLALVKAAAILRHRHRGRDARGRLLATLEDYETVQVLLEDAYAVTVTGVNDLVRAVVRAVQEARSDGVERVTYSEIARRLGFHHQQVRRAADVALRNGWLVNRALGKGAWADLAPGDPVPDRVGLPSPEEVARAWLSGPPGPQGGVHTSTGNPCAVVQFGREARHDGLENCTLNCTDECGSVQNGPAAMEGLQTAQSGAIQCAVSRAPEPAPDLAFPKTAQLHTPNRKINTHPTRLGSGVGVEGVGTLQPQDGSGKVASGSPSTLAVSTGLDPGTPMETLEPARGPSTPVGAPESAPERPALQEELLPDWAMRLAEELPREPETDPRQVARAIATLLGPPEDPSPPAEPCWCCGGRRWWLRPRDLGSAWICQRCHPAPPGLEPAAWHEVEADGPEEPAPSPQENTPGPPSESPCCGDRIIRSWQWMEPPSLRCLRCGRVVAPLAE
jgi:hypothetical protein